MERWSFLEIEKLLPYISLPIHSEGETKYIKRPLSFIVRVRTQNKCLFTSDVKHVSLLRLSKFVEMTFSFSKGEIKVVYRLLKVK